MEHVQEGAFIASLSFNQTWHLQLSAMVVRQQCLFVRQPARQARHGRPSPRRMSRLGTGRGRAEARTRRCSSEQTVGGRTRSDQARGTNAGDPNPHGPKPGWCDMSPIISLRTSWMASSPHLTPMMARDEESDQKRVETEKTSRSRCQRRRLSSTS